MIDRTKSLAAAHPVHTRVDIGPGGPARVSETVFCHDAGRSRATAECSGCPRFVDLSAGPDRQLRVVCRAVGPVAPRIDAIAAQAARVTLSELGRHRFVCLRDDLSLEAAEDTFVAAAADVLLVVDMDGLPLGTLSLADAARHRREVPSAVVREAMVPLVHVLEETAPLSFAIALLAAHGLAVLPLVDRAGVAVGLFTAGDALRWLAVEMGYVVPPPGA